MIKEAYCSFDICKLLKEKGFDEECICYCDNEGVFNSCTIKPPFINHEFSSYFTAPTQQMAMAWLREKRIIITMDYDEYEISDNKKVGYGWNIQKIEKPTEYFKISIHVFDNYEETVEDALKYCLTNLI